MKLVEGWPAIIIEKPDPAIVVSDIHYGFEVDLNDRGIRIPSQTMKITSSLMKLVKENGVQKVIILGDLKHKIPKSSRIEWEEMPRALKSLIEAGIEVHLIPGNHDGGIRKILGNLVSYSPSSG
ncbi:MAG: metallophosphoesterase, partial [Candidatus Caldarchaeales archaeon]